MSVTSIDIAGLTLAAEAAVSGYGLGRVEGLPRIQDSLGADAKRAFATIEKLAGGSGSIEELKKRAEACLGSETETDRVAGELLLLAASGRRPGGKLDGFEVTGIPVQLVPPALELDTFEFEDPDPNNWRSELIAWRDATSLDRRATVISGSALMRAKDERVKSAVREVLRTAGTSDEDAAKQAEQIVTESRRRTNL